MASLVWLTSESQQALAPIFGLRNANLHAIINDESGQLQIEAWRRYKDVMALERQRLRREAVEKRLWIRGLRKLYRLNQSIMRSVGKDPGLPAPSFRTK